MKFIVIVIGIIATITYIFLSGTKGVPGRAMAEVNRRQEVWDRVGQLEAKRRDMLIRADMRLGGGGLARPARATRGGPWAQGYQAGFEQGYFVGSFLAANRRPNPLFFPIPNP